MIRLSADLLHGGTNASRQGFIQALTSVPEPDTLLRLAVGLAGLPWMSAAGTQTSARPSRPKR